jgi:multiple sugar transport system permease protein
MRLKTLSRGGYYALMTIIAVPFIFPTLWMLAASLKSSSEIFARPLSILPSKIEWSNYVTIFREYPFAIQSLNSVYIAVVVTLATMALSAIAGYGFARLSFPGRDILFIACLSAMMLPTEAVSIPQFAGFRMLGLIDSHVPVILLQVFGGTGALATFLMRQHFLTLPREIDEAALVDGLGRWGIFWRVLLPMSKSALTAVAIFAFLNSWNDFFNPLVYLNSNRLFTVPLALQAFTDPLGGIYWHLTLAASALTTLPLLVAFLLAQRQFIESLTSSGLKG